MPCLASALGAAPLPAALHALWPITTERIATRAVTASSVAPAAAAPSVTALDGLATVADTGPLRADAACHAPTRAVTVRVTCTRTRRVDRVLIGASRTGPGTTPDADAHEPAVLV